MPSDAFRFSQTVGVAIAFALLFGSLTATANSADFTFDNKALPEAKPWTSEKFNNDPDQLSVRDHWGPYRRCQCAAAPSS